MKKVFKNPLLVKFFIGGSGALVVTTALIVNHSEHYRMARMIKQGSLRPSAATFDAKYCQFPIGSIESTLKKDPDLFCGLVGNKSTGKSTTLEYVASKQKNCIYCNVDGNGSFHLDDIIYGVMKDSIFTMPWFLSQIRLNGSLKRRTIIEKVFRKVKENTGEPVTVVVDIASENDLAFDKEVLASAESMKDAFMTKNASISFSSFNATVFTKQVKHYVADAKVMRCLFAASEGLMFQAEALREPRLKIYLSKELTIDMSKTYLDDKCDVPVEIVDNLVLQKFPRTFSSLRSFADTVDKDEFIRGAFKSEKAKIEETFRSCSVPLLPFSRHPVLSLYQLALQRPIQADDIQNICRLSESQFLAAFVKTNIFQPTKGGEFILQFDVTKEAVETVVKEKLSWY